MTQEDLEARIAQLQQQQALFTASLRAMLQGEWAAGPATVEAYLYALDPNMQGNVELDVPVIQSEYEQPPKV
jgi:hypothetical protein